jgi:phosphoribosyl 1,2-cyclic phosphodiesterase
MQIAFWGVRGAIPAPGPEFNRYGGNTACVAVRAGNALLILDAGTGIIPLGNELMRGPFAHGAGVATILLTHAHWDHIQGFPFFRPVYVPGNRFVIHGPSESPAAVEGILEGQMNPHFSPVQTLRNLGATITCKATGDGTLFAIDGTTITARRVPHGNIDALAYRIEAGGRALVYVPDAGYPDGQPAQELLDFYRGAHALIHDCTYTPEDWQRRHARGYASIAIAARTAARSDAQRLVMFHYDQDYTDEQLDEAQRACRKLLDAEPAGADVALVGAREGMVLEI